MAFNTPGTMIVMSAIGGWEPWEAVLTKVDQGWDTLVASYISRQPAATAEMIAAQWSLGQSIGGSFWVCGVKPIQKVGGHWVAELTCKGVSGSRPPKITGGTATETQQAKKINTPEGLKDKLQVVETMPIVELEYISLAGAPTHRVGTQGAPGFVPSIRPSVWTSLSSYLYHWPNGWVLVDLPWERITGTNVTLYRERWQYVYRYSPGGD